MSTLLVGLTVAWLALYDPAFNLWYLSLDLPMNDHALFWLSERWFLYGVALLICLSVLTALPVLRRTRTALPSWWPGWLAWIGWAAVSIFYSIDHGASVHGWLAVVSCGLLAYMAHHLVAAQGAMRRFSRFLVGVAVAAGMYGVVQYCASFKNAVPLLDAFLTQAPTGSRGWWGYSVVRDVLERGRVSSVFGWPNLFAGFILLLLPLTVALARSARSSAARFGYWVGAVVLAGCLVLTLSVSAWIAAVITAGIAIPLSASRVQSSAPLLRRRIMWTIGITPLLVVGLLAGSVLIGGRVGTFSAGSLHSRVAYAAGALSVIRQYPMTGTGIGTFATSYWTLMPAQFLGGQHSARHAHNAVLEWTAELGLIGLGLLGWWLVKVWAVIREALQGARSGLRYWLALGAIAFFIHGLIEQTTVDMAVAPFWWLVVGLLSGAASSRNARRPQSRAPNPLQTLLPGVLGSIALGLCMPLAAASILAGQGEIAVVHGRKDAAWHALTRAQRWDPLTSRYPLEVGKWALAQVVTGPAERAELLRSGEKQLQRAVALSPWSGAAWFLLGETQRQLGKSEQALDSYRSAAERDPNSAEALSRMAQLAHSTRRYHELLSAGQHFQRLMPSSPLGYYWEALGWEVAGDIPKALASYRSLVTRFPTYPRGLFSLARLLHDRGDVVEAQRYYAAFLAVAKPDETAERLR